MTNPVTETELAAAAVAPRVTEGSIQGKIRHVVYVRPIDTLTICVLRLANGFVVTGESACASPENYNQEIGERIAYNNAFQKIWALEGYVLCNRLAGLW